MHDGKGILLDFVGSTSLKNLVREYAGRIKYVSGPAKEQLGLSAVLIRPDGVVAWACEGKPDTDSAAGAASRWFGTPQPTAG